MGMNWKIAASMLAAFALGACGGQHLGEDVVDGEDTVALPSVVIENPAAFAIATTSAPSALSCSCREGSA